MRNDKPRSKPAPATARAPRRPAAPAPAPISPLALLSAGALVRSLRRRANLTLDRLAEEVELSKSHLSRYERGEKSLSVSSLMRLAKALGTSVAALRAWGSSPARTRSPSPRS